MQIVIDIPDDFHKDITDDKYGVYKGPIYNIIRSGAPLPKGIWTPSDVPESVLSKCSNCGFDTGAWTFNYCPKCGAKMEI